jgi:hypothetical protein
VTDGEDRSSRVRSLVAAAKKSLGGDKESSGDSAPAAPPTAAAAVDETGGPLGKVKAVLAKATDAVTGIVNKDDPSKGKVKGKGSGSGKGKGSGAVGAVADQEPTEHARKMKDAVEAARKAREGTDSEG